MDKVRHVLYKQFRLPLPELMLFQQILFGIAFFLYASMRWYIRLYVLERDQGITLYLSMLVQIICIILLVIKACVQRYDVLRLLLIFLFSSLAIVSAMHSEKLLLWALLFIVCGQNIHRDTLGWSSLSSCLFTIALNTVFAVQGRSVEIPLIAGAKGMRFSLGFTHPNTAALFCVVLVVSIALLLPQHPIFVSLLAINWAVFVFILFNSRTEVIGLIFIAGYLIIAQMAKERLVRIINYLICFITVSISILSFIASYLYQEKSQVFAVLNKVFSDRLNLLHGYLQSGFTLFGKHPSLFTASGTSSTGDNLTLVADNLYVKVIIVHGVICGGVILLCLLTGQLYFARENQSLFPLYSAPLIMGISEGFGLFPDQNVLIIGLARVLYKGLEDEMIPHHAKHKYGLQS